jgi:hypothetical protein
MRLKCLALLAIVGFILTPAPAAHAQISFGIDIGGGYPDVGPPVCQYGYYGYAPYACAPYGYYGPQWFNGGVFLGAGPWYGHGWGGYGNREGWGHDRGGWGGGRGYVGGGFHGGGGGFRGGGGVRGGGGGGRGGGHR